ncbi:hypothetical protein NLU13_8880 [Sarocladium strictum]|uniref:Uncharacterized protein n=1 Tax=Sarocladium strictum TaxID=5046 RepID=A0AA39G9P8_SARSR|nr:hypothetical protein NLU13_8880 [Sarocladium strictum]
MVRFTVLSLIAAASGVLAGKDLVLEAKFDPTNADTVEDAAWNCVVDFARDNPDDICGKAVNYGPRQKFADMCALGDVLLYDTLQYEFCRQSEISEQLATSFTQQTIPPRDIVFLSSSILTTSPGRKRKSPPPSKRPCVRCMERSAATPSSSSPTRPVVKINLTENIFTAPATLTITPSGEPVATVTISHHPVLKVVTVAYNRLARTTLETIVKTTATTGGASLAIRTRVPEAATEHEMDKRMCPGMPPWSMRGIVEGGGVAEPTPRPTLEV